MDRFDSIIIGGGHNGLVCAAYLAQGGQRVLVLEAADAPGGLAASREFHPGFHASIAHSASHFSRKIADDLNLAAYGLGSTVAPMPTIGLNHDGNNVVIDGDSLSGTGADDVDAYQRYRQLMHRFADALAPFWLKTIPRIGSNSLSEIMSFAHMGLNIRRLGRKDMGEFLRIASLPARDLMDEYFDNDILKAVLSWDGLIGAKMAPRSPNSAVLTMLYRLAGETRGAHVIPQGGVAALAAALAASAVASGAEIRCDSPVNRILIDASGDGQVATGVELADGTKIEAARVVAATDAKRTFLDLVGVAHLDIGFTNRIRRLRCDGLVGKLHLALDGPPVFTGIDRADGRMIIAPDMDAIEFAFDDAKYGDCSANPVLEIVVPSVHDASLAPAGQHVLSAHVMYVPNKLRNGWTDAARDKACDTAVDVISRYAPAIREQIVHREFLTPADIGHQYHVTGGHWHHTEFAMDQMLMMRPTYEAAQYGTPIAGLYLCGAGSHPGGDLVGAAGHNAAREILR